MPNSLSNAAERRARQLADAAASGDAARVEALLAAGARADAPTRAGETPLMCAASLGYEDVARALLEAGADACARRADGFTPLTLAVFNGHGRVVRLLLTYGADARARTRLGTTPESWAAARGFEEIASLLRNAGAEGAQSAVGTQAVSADTPAAALRRAAAAEFESVEAVFGSRESRASAPGGVQVGAGERDFVSAGAKDSAGAKSHAGEKDSAGDAESESAGAPHVAARRGVQRPAHPSPSAFSLGAFLRSWQASVGTALLLLALGVVAYAVWRGGKSPQTNTRPAQVSQSPAPQAVAQPPAPSVPAAQASPAITPTPDAQNGLLPPGVNGAAYVPPAQAGQPYYVPPGASSPGQAGLPAVPAVISESGAPSPSPEDASRSKRRNDAARDASSGSQPANGRDDADRDNDARSDASRRDARAPASEPQTAPAVRQTQPPAPQPSSTPERGKVIPWPPQ